MAKAKSKEVSIGLRSKTGRAIAVVLSGPAGAPQFIRRTEVKLTDPADEATSQPYHEVIDLPWHEAKIAAKQISAKIEIIAAKALSNLVQELKSDGFNVARIGIAGAGDRDLERIGSTHIRAHAAEGVLFRHVLQIAAAENELKSRAIDERVIDDIASVELKRPPAEIKNHLAELGRIAGSPWRSDEKTAALAAWLALAGRAKK